ncbi:MAG: thioether cross-link-forming SCIFF peptide maturase [Defluviitaleaceae bacterium]|nr:thioether cross-link-forming SCIFF peptide maturase [Defluviitaleaceae bacterium]MCL2836856.1 thioether cross-link-forming SCIFF peptide maturase [Defluviitaleaceae bacterium]
MIHKYELNGFHIIIDTNSGAVHVATASVCDVLDYYETKSREEILAILGDRYPLDELSRAFDEIDGLISAGMLFSKDPYENLAEHVKNSETVVKALCLLVAHGCNLKCGYCFASDITDCAGQGMMDLETGKRAIDFLIENSGNRKNLEVDFFGGEPLLNFGVIVKIVEYAREREKETAKNIRFTLTTNGLLLDDKKLDFINKEMSNIVLSLDGRKEVNDRMRKGHNGEGCYDRLVPVFQKAAESRKQNNYYIRGTFTKFNLDFASDVLHLADLGFKQISVEPVIGPESVFTIKDEDIPRIREEYIRLTQEMIAREKSRNPFNFFHFMIDLTGGPCALKRLGGCGAGTEYLAATADGELYPCHQFAGIPEFKVGTIHDFDINNRINKSFSLCNVYSNDKCRDCWGKFYCGGGCAANAYAENGDISVPYKIGCDLQLIRTECAIMMKAALFDSI